MPRFVIERDMPGAGRMSVEELRSVTEKSCGVLRGLGPQIQWVESYVTDDKVYCVYIADNEEVIREHARISGFPADCISRVRSVVDPPTADVGGEMAGLSGARTELEGSREGGPRFHHRSGLPTGSARERLAPRSTGSHSPHRQYADGGDFRHLPSGVRAHRRPVCRRPRCTWREAGPRPDRRSAPRSSEQ